MAPSRSAYVATTAPVREPVGPRSESSEECRIRPLGGSDDPRPGECDDLPFRDMSECVANTDRIVVLVLPEVNLLDLGGPVQVFDTATKLGAGYRLEYVAAAAETVTAQGLRLAGLGDLPETRPGDLVLIPGPRLRPPAPDRPLVSDAVVRWLRTARERGARMASVCSGAAALGEAGRLDGRRCTTHWGLIEAMRARYPAARVRDAVLYVHDGPISTSAGVSAGIDLALSLVERDHGPALTAAVARELVVYLRRDGSNAQISPFLEHRAHLNPAVHKVQDHLAQHLDASHSLADLAALAHLSPRGLSRAFIRTIGVTPLEYQQQLRMEQATTLLAETDLTIDAVAARCGFQDARHFRRLFSARFGGPPSASRRRAG
jgi:transcriptional regulator GlxA family with amidase domain